jgi:glycyl-tRNA synthetase beta chain
MGTAQLDISLGLCLELALDQHDVEHREQIQEELTGFFRRRFEALLRDEGFRHEVIQAVLEAGFDRVPEVWRRASTLKEFHAHEAFDDVMTVFTRAHNLATNAQSAEVHQELLSEEEEVQLYRAVEEAEVALESCIKERDYLGYLEATAVLREPVDTMLDNLMVMVDEESIQRNRLALLRRVDKLFEPYFDLTQLEW